MELISCHDCGNPVALSARQCPQCGSKESSGPYRPSKRAARKNGIEQRNDRCLASAALSCGLLGACYGFATSSGAFSAIFWVLAYGIAGLTVGIPIGFAINFLRS
jgi:hypothetical protein